jgi:hypothetical protein
MSSRAANASWSWPRCARRRPTPFAFLAPLSLTLRVLVTAVVASWATIRPPLIRAKETVPADSAVSASGSALSLREMRIVLAVVMSSVPIFALLDRTESSARVCCAYQLC